MGLLCRADALPVGRVDMGPSSFSTTLVHGATASLMVATRPGGYHSRPHTHDCEQLNLVQEGELHVYCVERAYHLRPGDVLRIPAGAVHWSWNRTDAPCVLIEVHAPGLQRDPGLTSIAVGLFDDGEPADAASAINVDVELPEAAIARIESLDPPALA
jgi:mannose-6-phosphate isomerase-like protein (cupin superfamily)